MITININKQKTILKIKTTATSANLGSGFDILGLDVPRGTNLYNEVIIHFDNSKLSNTNTVITNNTPINIKGYGSDNIKLKGVENPVIKTFISELDIKKEYITITKIEFINNIPFSNGLGSSSSANINAIIIALYLNKQILKDSNSLTTEDKNLIYNKCLILEKHGDNILPCIFGGIQIVSKNPIQIKIPKGLYLNIFINTKFSSSTEEARKKLPKTVSLSEAIKNSENLANLILGIQNKNEDLLYIGTEGRLHQPYRKEVYPESMKLVEDLRKNNIPAYISGSGATVAAITTKQNIINNDYKGWEHIETELK
jgi:homoserine kinase